MLSEAEVLQIKKDITESPTLWERPNNKTQALELKIMQFMIKQILK